MTHNTYDERNIRTMEAVWGVGYMSPGGDAEVERIVGNVVSADARLLDFGCGVGGASIAMAKLGVARSIVAVDIESTVLSRAKQLAEEAGVSDRIQWQQVSPGPLPFEDGSFDFVYANSVTCHIQDLKSVAGELRRVLANDGEFIGSEWYVGENRAVFEQWDTLLRQRGLNFHFVPREVFAAQLEAGGFRTPTFRDRTPAMTRIAEDGQRKVMDELRDSLTAELGEEGFSAFAEWGELRAEVLRSGGMRHGHFFAACQ